MPAVPLGIGAYKRTDGPLPEVKLFNFYLEEDKSGLSPDKLVRIQRPGLQGEHTYAALIRAAHYRSSNGERLVISGSTLFSSTVSKGSVGSDGALARIASTPFASLIASAGAAFLYTTTVVALPMPDDAPAAGYVTDVDQLNGYGLFLLPNGRFYYLPPGETVVDPLDFATAESLPDGGVALRRLGDEFWVFGAENIEPWQATGDADAPFQRAAGRTFERGCLWRDAVCRFDNTLFWVGDDYQVYRASNVPQVISNPGMAERIRKATGPGSAWTFAIDGHSFYVLRIPGQGTWVYDASTREWPQWGADEGEGWAPWVGYQFKGDIFAGSSVDGKLWRVTPDALADDGVIFPRIVSGTVPIIGKPPRNDSISIGVNASDDTIVRVRWCDGQDDYPGYYDEIDVRGQFDVATMWRLGQPQQPYRTFEISSVAPERLSITGMMANESWA